MFLLENQTKHLLLCIGLLCVFYVCHQGRSKTFQICMFLELTVVDTWIYI
jgi:hypothetical protein